MKPNSRRRSTPGTSSSPKQGGNRESEESEDTENSEIRRIRDSQDSDEKHDIPLLGTRICTFQEAVDMARSMPLQKDAIFTFARALRSMEATLSQKLTKKDLDSAFSLYWAACLPELPTDAEHDEYRFDFLKAFEKARAPLGANHLEEALKRAGTYAPPAADRYTSPKLKLLVALCYHLQVLSENSPFFLSVRSVMECLGLKSTHQASDFLNGLVLDGVLEYTEKGTPGGKRASRFRFVGRIPGRGQA